MKSLLLLGLFSFYSCANQARFQFEPNRNLWVGKTSDELAEHPVFASYEMTSRKTESGIETRSFQNKGGSQSFADCGRGSCVGFSEEIVCNHVFLLKKNIISDYNRVGACGAERLEMRPLQEDGTPTYTEEEIERYNGREVAGEETTRDCGMIGKILKAQGCK